MNEIPKSQMREVLEAFRSGKISVSELQHGVEASLNMFHVRNQLAHEGVTHQFGNDLERILHTLLEKNQRAAALEVCSAVERYLETL